MRIPKLDVDAEVVEYDAGGTEEEIAEWIRDATIIVMSGTPLRKSAIERAERLQLVNANGVGIDHIDKEAVLAKGACITHIPGQGTSTVVDHAFALYFALARRIYTMHDLTMDGTTWPREKTVHLQFPFAPRAASEETLVVVGYGMLGQNIERVGKALGMTIIIAERKGAKTIRPGRTEFDEAMKAGTVFMLAMPAEASTINMFGAREIEMMNSEALIVNVGRGNTIDEAALIQALRDGRLGGAGVDVFRKEPATKENNILLDRSIPNLIVSPHIAW